MPWTSRSFASKHDHKLKGHAAEVAATAANAALKSGKSEGAAVRIGNAAGNRAMSAKHVRKKNG